MLIEYVGMEGGTGEYNRISQILKGNYSQNFFPLRVFLNLLGVHKYARKKTSKYS